MCCFTYCIAIIFIFFITNTAYCQTKPAATPDTISLKNNAPVADSISSSVDSVRKASVAIADTSKKKRLEAALGIRLSKDALTSVVKAESRDSAVLDMEHNLFYLYGKAKTNYEDLQLTSGQITYEQASNIVSAAPYQAQKDTGADKQTFTQGKEKFTYDSLQYNFKSKRAIVRNVRSQYGEGYVYSEQVKRSPDQSIYGSHSVYTTCALDTPHFGIVAKKIKVIPGKVIISGPANLCIEGIPTPLFVPFGLFPVSQKQRSGFVLPTYTIEEQRGLGLLNGGYYFYVNDHVDLLAQTNLYAKGSYAVSAMADYKTLYRYTGNLNLSYAYNKTGEDFEPGASVKKDFMVTWRHQSDGKSVPGQNFTASVQAGSSSYYSNNSYDPNQILQNQYQSNVSYSKNWQGKPFGLTISALHSQNTGTKQINVTLPSMTFYVSQFSPFQSKHSVGSHWYDKITTSYSVDFVNRTTFYDSTLNLSNISTRDFQTGMVHKIPVSASYTILRYVQMSFNVNYNEYWLTQKLYTFYNDSAQKLDSIDTRGFYAARDFSAGVNFSTRIYGMKLFRHSSLRGIRHVLSPSVGLSFHPDFGASPFNYYYRSRVDTSRNIVYHSPYATSIVGYPANGKAGQVNFGINNNLQIKVKSNKDKDTATGYRNVTLIDGLSVNASYNPAVDSFQWSNISTSFRTNIADKINISSSATFNPYAFDYTLGREIPKLMEQMGFGLARFTSANVAIGTNFHSKPVGSSMNPTNSEEYSRIVRNAGYNDYVDMNIPWSFNISYSLSADNHFNTISRRDTVVISQNVMFQTELQLSRRWKVTMSSGYNFNYHQLTSTSIDIYRDLHCWAMHMQTIPFGPRKSFNFTINVKSAVLQDLKLVRRRDYRDSPT